MQTIRTTPSDSWASQDPSSGATSQDEFGSLLQALAKTPPNVPSTEFAPGYCIEKFQILGVRGRGGFGIVYSARDMSLGRLVALKLARHPTLSEEATARFRREAQLVGSLSHPGIVKLYEFGEHAGYPYLVFEYLEGETLQEKLERGPLGLEQVLRYGLEMIRALEYAHAQGVVHRDLKPGNVFITHHDTVAILDFGLARLLQELSPGDAAGTRYFSSPQQLEGSSMPDCRDDLYSFGMVLYAALTAMLPHAATVRGELVPHPLPSNRWCRPSPPWSFRRLLHQCTAFDPALRPTTAASVRKRLSAIEARRFRSWASYANLVMWLAAGAAIVLLSNDRLGDAEASRLPGTDPMSAALAAGFRVEHVAPRHASKPRVPSEPLARKPDHGSQSTAHPHPPRAPSAVAPSMQPPPPSLPTISSIARVAAEKPAPRHRGPSIHVAPVVAGVATGRVEPPVTPPPPSGMSAGQLEFERQLAQARSRDVCVESCKKCKDYCAVAHTYDREGCRLTCYQQVFACCKASGVNTSSSPLSDCGC